MHAVTIDEAKQQLPDLIDEALAGGEVLIAKDAGVAVRLVPVTPSASRPRFGSAKGLVTMADDFDAPLDDFTTYMP